MLDGTRRPNQSISAGGHPGANATDFKSENRCAADKGQFVFVEVNRRFPEELVHQRNYMLPQPSARRGAYDRQVRTRLECILHTPKTDDAGPVFRRRHQEVLAMFGQLVR